MRTALVLLGHADPDSFNAALAGAYVEGLRAAGVQATLVRLAELRFDPVLRHGYRAPQALEPDLEALKARFEAADHVAWFFPTYWASPPAIVRAVVDRLFVPGWAFRYEEGSALPKQLLAGKSGRVVTTMDSPWWWYGLWHHRAIHGAFVKGTLRFVGFSPVETTTIYRARALDAAARAQRIAAMRTDGGRDAARLAKPAAHPALTAAP